MKSSLSRFLKLSEMIIFYLHELGIDEIDATIILLVDSITKKERIIESSALLKYLTISPEEADQRFASLIQKNLITWENDTFWATGTIEALSAIILKEDEPSCYTFLEKELGRPLNATEISLVEDWITAGLSFYDIVDGWRIALQQNKKTLLYLDGILSNEIKQRIG